ncbi:AAA family ATPase [Vibrio breoganii]|uniref:AAA family ATPase n=1 Tax=Vibrio breoganii TaxID=553239 RepID=UPI0039A40DF9
MRVRNFRSINDSGEITTDNLTAILGRNESGKSNILLALQHLSPSGGMTEIEAIRELLAIAGLGEQDEGHGSLILNGRCRNRERESLSSIFLERLKFQPSRLLVHMEKQNT